MWLSRCHNKCFFCLSNLIFAPYFALWDTHSHTSEEENSRFLRKCKAGFTIPKRYKRNLLPRLHYFIFKILCLLFSMFHSTKRHYGYSSIIHTRLLLNVCSLNYYLFNIGRDPSPECLCGFEIESINHYFLHCPFY